jgi:glycosyltransferase involved in cell wall biosynthesis
VPSLATKREIERVAPFASERVVHIPNGVSEQFVPLDQMNERDAMLSGQYVSRLLSGAPKFVMDVGRAAPYRNNEGLVRGFAMAFRGDEDVHLVFVQPVSSNAGRLMRLADKVGIADRLHILSGVSSKHLVSLYQHASCICHPTLHEAYGAAVTEAMACGCPVITSGRAAAGELVEGVAQFVNPEHDDEIAAALRRVLFEPGVAQRMRARGLARASSLGVDKTVRRIWQVYREVLAEA